MLRIVKRYYRLKDGTKGWSYQVTGVCPYTKKPVREGTRTRDRKVAEAILARENELRRQQALHGTAGGITFAHAVMEYAQKRGERERRFVDPLLDRFAHKRLADIEDADLTTFCDEHYPGRKPSTLVRQVYGPMQAIWNLAVDLKMAPPRTFVKPEIERRETRYDRNDNVLRKVVRELRWYEDICALVFMTMTGARATEVVNIKVKHYDPKSATVELVDRKNDEDHVVAFPEQVNDMLLVLVEDRDPEERLFRIKSRWTLYKTLHRASKRAGIPPEEFLSPHKIGRHTFAARFLAQGNSLAALQDAGGWKSIGAVMRYKHLEKKAVHAMMRKVASPLLERSAQYLHNGELSDQRPNAKPLISNKKSGKDKR